MFWLFGREERLRNLRERIVALEVDFDGIKKKIDNLNLDLQTSKQKKRIVKEEEKEDKPKDLYSSVILPER